MLTDTGLRSLKPKDKAYKVTDGGGMHAAVSKTGVISFRYDYRLNEFISKHGKPAVCRKRLIAGNMV